MQISGARDAKSWLGLAIAALFLVLYIVPLNERPLFVPDESRYAEIPREMIMDGDWARLHQAGLRYYEKPPLGYWLIALSQHLLGYTFFAVRLPIALSVGVAALAVYLLTRRFRQNATRASTAAMIYLSCLGVYGVGTFATLDSLFAAFVCLSMAALYVGAGAAGRRRVLWLVLSGAACSAAFLTKGFTALVIPALTLAAWLSWERRFRDLLTLWIVPVVAAFAVTLPVALVIHARNPDFWNYFFWIEHVQRFLQPSGGQHRQPFWYYLPVLAAGAAPWTFLMPAAVGEIRKKASQDSLTRFCLCWFGMQFLFFSACGGKLPTYILPGFAPLAILLADALLDARNNAFLRRGALAGALLFLIALAGFFIWLPHSGDTFLTESLLGDAKTIGLAASIAAFALCLYRASRVFASNGSRLNALGWMALSLCAPALAGFYLLPQSIKDRKSPISLLREGVPLTPPNARLLTDRTILPAVCWQYRRSDPAFFGDPGELRYGINHSGAQDRYFAAAEPAGEWVSQSLAAGIPVATCFRDDIHDIFVRTYAGAPPVAMRETFPYVWALYVPSAHIPKHKTE